MLILKGHPFGSSRLFIRFLAGAWCAGCFFLIQIYCSTLKSHLMSPNEKLIANSVDDIAHFPNVDVTVDQGLGLRIMILVYNLYHLEDILNIVFQFYYRAQKLEI